MAGYDVTREIDAWWDHYGHEATAPNFGAIISLDDEILIERFENSLDDYGQAVANSIRTDVIQTVGTRGGRGALTTKIQETIDRERWRAERIARTELQHAYNASHHGTLKYARDSGLMDDMGKTCIVTYDYRTDDDSLPLDGQVKALDDMFVDGDGRRYLHPPGRPNDREKEVAHPLEDAEPGDEDPRAEEKSRESEEDGEPVQNAVRRSIEDGRSKELGSPSSVEGRGEFAPGNIDGFLTSLDDESDTPSGVKFDRDKLNRIKGALEKQKVDVLIGGKDVERHLRFAGARASFMPDEQGGILMFGEDPDRVSVVEELIHLGQRRRFSDDMDGLKEFVSRRIEHEVEAQDRLLELADRLGWTRVEKEAIQNNLQYWMDQRE